VSRDGRRARGDGFAPAARLDALPPGTVLGVVLPDGRRVCLVNVDGTVRALRDECTHQAFPMSAGELRADGTIECAWHGARFDAATGAVRSGPACDALDVYAVRVVDGAIEVGPATWLPAARGADGAADAAAPPAATASPERDPSPPPPRPSSASR
jgi:3-phenylpropionate/trans-cinnamate dioxygenase ferredoxin component